MTYARSRIRTHQICTRALITQRHVLRVPQYLDYNYLSMPYLRKTYNAAHTWLAAINAAALHRQLPVQMCMALPSDLMESVRFDAVTNYRSSTDYGISDSTLPLQPRDDNINIGASSLLGFALGLRPSKDVLWTMRPENCRGRTDEERAACGGKGAGSNPGSNIELNAIVATLSTGPVSLADKAHATNVTIVRRCARRDGRILQPDKPATAVDSMLIPSAWPSAKAAPPGMVWATSVGISGCTWHYVLSIDVGTPWRIHAEDFYPAIPSQLHADGLYSSIPSPGGVSGADAPGAEVTDHSPPVDVEAVPSEGWVAHQWFTAHEPTRCTHGQRALASGCVSAHVRSASDVPPLHNTRPIMMQNDTYLFDLMELAPVVSGWVLLGEVGAYVRVSRVRFEAVSVSLAGLRAGLVGSRGEKVEVTALRPVSSSTPADWVVMVKSVTIGVSGKAEVVFES